MTLPKPTTVAIDESHRIIQMATIVGLCIFMAVAYGIVHDQVTARLCVEYFTVAHPPMFATTSPTMLGICWGIAATFGVGALLGMLLALVSQSGDVLAVPTLTLLRSILVLLAVTAISASLAGIAGFLLSCHSIVSIPAEFAETIPREQHDRFMAVWFAHGASYLVGLLGGSFLIVRIWLARGMPRVLAIVPRSKGGIVRALIIAALGIVALWFRFVRL
jgi:hypothetical protein